MEFTNSNLLNTNKRSTVSNDIFNVKQLDTFEKIDYYFNTSFDDCGNCYYLNPNNNVTFDNEDAVTNHRNENIEEHCCDPIRNCKDFFNIKQLDTFEKVDYCFNTSYDNRGHYHYKRNR